jgi:hypothetical protein
MDDKFWTGMQKVAENTADQRPGVGKRVLITKGRKHINKTGIVFWHGWDKFNSPTRYMSNAQITMAEILGRHGFRIGVETEDGERFYCPADYAEVLNS